MEGDLFVQTIQAMKAVSSALSDYIQYAGDLTSGSPTSTFKLMERSVRSLNMYMRDDFQSAFGWVYKMAVNI